MAANWNSSDARAHHLSPRREADLIRDLAEARTLAALTHPKVCGCVPCKVRRIDHNRRSLAELLAQAGVR